MPSQRRKAGVVLIVALVFCAFVVLLYSTIIQSQQIVTMRLWLGRMRYFLSISMIGTAVAQNVDLGWYPPSHTPINNLSTILTSQGVYGFIFNSSETPDGQYGTYNWCNMPHVRKSEYTIPSSDYELAYVEVVSLTPTPRQSTRRMANPH